MMTLYTGWEQPAILTWTKVCGPPGGQLLPLSCSLSVAL